MTKTNSSNSSYAELANRLEAVMNRLQSSDLDVDEALKLYQQGLELVQQTEAYLENVGNTVIELKAKFNNKSK